MDEISGSGRWIASRDVSCATSVTITDEAPRTGRTDGPAWTGSSGCREPGAAGRSRGHPPRSGRSGECRAMAGSILTWRASSIPSIPGIMRSSSTAANGVPPAAAVLRASRAAGPLSTRVGTMPHARRTSSRIRRFVALSSTTRTAVPASLPARLLVSSSGTCPVPQPHREPEGAPRTELALRRDPPAHELDQLARDGQSQAGSPVPSGRRPVHLFKRLEDHSELLRGNAHPGVA